jgi:hypothetical protein
MEIGPRGQLETGYFFLSASRMSALRQRTNPLSREGPAARSGDYVCRSNYLNERK